MNDIYIARQPIYDSSLQQIGYELLYRNSEKNIADFDDDSIASSETIVNSFIHIGIDNLVGTSLAFVNLPSEFILNNSLIPMFHEQAVLEILEHVEPTAEIIEGLLSLKSKGYKIALDDFSYSKKMDPMLALADFVKIDVLEYKEDELLELINSLREKYGVKLIAEKVETQQLFERCNALNFDFYQGYFFCRPQMVVEKNISSSKLVVMNLISKIQDPEVEIDELEAILSQDVALTYKLLRYINSAAFTLRREIDTLKDAIVLLGLESIKNWASLILMSRVVGEKPQQLITTALIRAKMAELLSHHINPTLEKPAFICGLFSVLDALMDKEMVDLLDSVILSTKIKIALLDYDGELGIILKNCISYEKAQFDELSEGSFNSVYFNEAYLAAVKWADDTMRELEG